MITVFNIFDEYGPDNCKIELVELYPCNSKIELERREGHYIKDNECVNRIIVGRTKLEYYSDNKERIKQKVKEYRIDHLEQVKEKQKEYRQDNKETLKEKNKQYLKEHREELLERMKEYYRNNQETLKENAHDYYQENKDKVMDYKKTKYTCEVCNLCLRVGDKAKHIKTKRHLHNLKESTSYE